MKIFLLLTIYLVACLTYVTHAQITSAATGNWSDGATWAGGVSTGASDNVIIATGHTVTLTANTAFNNLTLNGANSGTRLALSDYTLEVSGTLNADGTTLSSSLITSVAGKLKFIGNSRALFGVNWAANPPSWRFEVALNSGQTGRASTNVIAAIKVADKPTPT